jgi:hypothetical protein
LRKIKRGGSPSNGRELFPRRIKERESHCEMGRQREKQKQMAHKNKWHTKTMQTKQGGALH